MHTSTLRVGWRVARVLAACWLLACGSSDEPLPPLDAAARAMLDPRRAAALDRDGIVRLLFERGDPRGERVADVGTGPGFFVPALARAVGVRGALVLTDVRRDYLAHASARARAAAPRIPIRTVIPRPGRVDVEPSSVDAVLLVQVDHLFGARRPEMLVEAFRALRPGGRMLVAGTPRNRVPDEVLDALRAAGARAERRDGALRAPLAVLVADRDAPGRGRDPTIERPPR